MSNFIPQLQFSSSALNRIANILPKMLLSILKTRTISLFSCSLKHIFLKHFPPQYPLTLVNLCIPPEIPWVCPSFKAALAAARTSQDRLVSNLMSPSEWLLCNTVSQEVGLIGRHHPRLMPGNLGMSLSCKCKHKLLLFPGGDAMLAELSSLHGMLMKLMTVKLTFILVMRLIQAFTVVFLIHSISLCHCVLALRMLLHQKGIVKDRKS